MAEAQLRHTDNEPDFLNTRQAAAVLGLCEQTLRRKRIEGDGPPYLKLGDGRSARCAYRRSDLKAWLEAHTFASTSEATVAQGRK